MAEEAGTDTDRYTHSQTRRETKRQRHRQAAAAAAHGCDGGLRPLQRHRPEHRLVRHPVLRPALNVRARRLLKNDRSRPSVGGEERRSGGRFFMRETAGEGRAGLMQPHLHHAVDEAPPPEVAGGRLRGGVLDYILSVTDSLRP